MKGVLAEWQRSGGSGSTNKGILFATPDGVLFGVTKLSNGMRSVPLFEEDRNGLIKRGAEIEVTADFADRALRMFEWDQHFQLLIPEFDGYVK